MAGLTFCCLMLRVKHAAFNAIFCLLAVIYMIETDISFEFASFGRSVVIIIIAMARTVYARTRTMYTRTRIIAKFIDARVASIIVHVYIM